MYGVEEKHRIYGKSPERSVPELRRAFEDSRLDGVRYAVLFGSRARGETHVASDYDIAVLADRQTGQGWGAAAVLWERVGALCGLDDCDLDLVDLSEASMPLLDSIAEAYIMLKGDESGFRELLAELKESGGGGAGDSR